MTLEEIAAELGTMKAENASLKEQIGKLGTPITPPKDEPTPKTPEDIAAELKAAEQAKQEAKKGDIGRARAINFLKESKDLKYSESVKAVIAAYAGDKEDFIARQEWIQRAYANEAVANIPEHVLASQPSLQKSAITAFKAGNKGNVAQVFEMVREIEQNMAKAKEQADKNASLLMANKLSDEDIAKLTPEQQANYRSLQAGLTDGTSRWSKEKLNGGKNG